MLTNKGRTIHHRLGSLKAFRVTGAEPSLVLPKEWDGIEVQINGLAAELKARFPSQEKDDASWQRAYAAWRQESVHLLPAGIFVWREEFEESFKDDFSSKALTIIDDNGKAVERHGDRELTYAPMLPDLLRALILEGFQFPTITLDQAPQEYRQRFIQAEFWNEQEFLGLCLGVQTYSDQDEVAPRYERQSARELIWAALRSGELDAQENPTASAAESIYGGVWRIEPVRATRWALTRFPRFPEWLSSSKLNEIYEAQESEKQAAGRYTLKELAAVLAEKTGWATDRWLQVIVDAVLAEALPAKNPRDFADLLPYTPHQVRGRYQVREWYEQVNRDDVNRWLLSHPEWGAGLRVGTDAQETLAEFSSAENGPSKSKPLSRHRHQESEILRILRELGYDPKKLPPYTPGMPSVKSKVRNQLRFSPKIFNKAWERLLGDQIGYDADADPTPSWGRGGGLRGTV